MAELTIAQGSHYRGETKLEGTPMPYWDWWAWVEGPDAQLDTIEKVVWMLHPTFPKPVRARTNRRDKFRLETAGWGEFELRAELHFRDGGRQRLSHWIQLFAAEEATSESASPESKSSVFLAYGPTEAKLAAQVRSELLEQGIDVLDVADALPSLPAAAAIEELVGRTDGVIALGSTESEDRGVQRAIEASSMFRAPLLRVETAEDATKVAISRFLEYMLRSPGRSK